MWSTISVHAPEVLLILSLSGSLCFADLICQVSHLLERGWLYREAWHADSNTDKGGALVSQNQANWWGILCHDDTIKAEWVGKSIRFLLWLLCNSITAVPQGPKATTLSQEVLKRDVWIRAVVDKGKILPLCVPERGVILRIIKRAGEMYSWHCFLGW